MDSFSLGAVVLPALDGQLAALGYDVKELGPLALGFVIEEGSRRSHVHFPELKISLWLPHDEIKDVQEEMNSNPSFRVLEEYFLPAPQELLLPILAHHLITDLQATHVLGLEHGPLEDVWEENAAKLNELYNGNEEVLTFRLSLGLEELQPEHWTAIKKKLGPRLLLERILPSGMHKFELSLYLRR